MIWSFCGFVPQRPGGSPVRGNDAASEPCVAPVRVVIFLRKFLRSAEAPAEEVVSEQEPCPQRLKPSSKRCSYRSGEPLRHPKSSAKPIFSASCEAPLHPKAGRIYGRSLRCNKYAPMAPPRLEKIVKATRVMMRMKIMMKVKPSGVLNRSRTCCTRGSELWAVLC